jgi:hypothetical protein
MANRHPPKMAIHGNAVLKAALSVFPFISSIIRKAAGTIIIRHSNRNPVMLPIPLMPLHSLSRKAPAPQGFKVLVDFGDLEVARESEM